MNMPHELDTREAGEGGPSKHCYDTFIFVAFLILIPFILIYGISALYYVFGLVPVGP
jgi:hypothetical protein